MDHHTSITVALPIAAASLATALTVLAMGPASAHRPADGRAEGAAASTGQGTAYVDLVDRITYRKEQMSLARARGFLVDVPSARSAS